MYPFYWAHRMFLLSLIALSLIALSLLSSATATTTHTRLNSTSILTLSPSLSSVEPSSSSELSTSSSSSALPLPVKEILVVHDNCFFLEATDFNFVTFSRNFENISAYELSLRYPKYTDNVTGCDGGSSIHTFRRYYYDNSTNQVIFYFSLEFTHENVDNSWHLSNLKSVNLTTNDSHIFVFADCGGAINVPEDLSYFCSQVDCYGHEQVEEHITGRLDMANLRVDAFIKSGSQPASGLTLCGRSSSSNKKAFLIVALVIGVTLTVTVVIIIASFIYKRCKYGRYNLLD